MNLFGLYFRRSKNNAAIAIITFDNNLIPAFEKYVGTNITKQYIIINSVLIFIFNVGNLFLLQHIYSLKNLSSSIKHRQ